MKNQENKIYDRVEAYKYVLRHDHGNVADLQKSLSSELFEDFLLLGFIKQGMDSKGTERWQVTIFGRGQLRESIRLLEQRDEIADIVLAF